MLPLLLKMFKKEQGSVHNEFIISKIYQWFYGYTKRDTYNIKYVQVVCEQKYAKSIIIYTKDFHPSNANLLDTVVFCNDVPSASILHGCQHWLSCRVHVLIYSPKHDITGE